MRQIGSALWRHLYVLQIHGANTDVGKTIFSSILCRSLLRLVPKVHYLKPVSTGPLQDADDVHLSSLQAALASSKCLYRFSNPVSPHIAARGFSGISDNEICTSVYDELQRYAHPAREKRAVIVEGAGGVLSPSPSGTLQADLYRPLRLPALLVGDHKLGGIGTTISAYESLFVRGYDVQGIGLFSRDRFENHDYLRQYFAERGVGCFDIEPPPARATSLEEDRRTMSEYYDRTSQSRSISNFIKTILQKHVKRISDLEGMPREANEHIWHPFLQHRERTEHSIVAMDSAYGDFFQTYKAPAKPHEAFSDTTASILKPAFDGSASWWTQGLGHGNPRLALTAAHAAGRYGHVMFASAVHEPALTLAKTLVQRMGNPKLSKVFYTDNGSTGMEVAVKMALRAASVRNGWSSEEDQIDVLGLTNSYHGDTIGTMDCSEPSLFNKKVEWYRGRGHWLTFPQVLVRKGQWRVEWPENASTEPSVFDSLASIFDFENRQQDAQRYRTHIDAELSRLRKQGVKLGALILEPIILGAGGMLFADPLFQRTLIQAMRSLPTPEPSADAITPSHLDWQGVPVIHDEVFTGLYRLGHFSASSLLGSASDRNSPSLSTDADIVVNAKLLTGGLLPLCTTTASESIFNAFLSDEKSDALLHGHSYTAHAVGCAVANESLEEMGRLDHGETGTWQGYRDAWTSTFTSSVSKTTRKAEDSVPEVWSMWSPTFLSTLSHKPNVDSCFAIGSVLAISVADAKGAGYASTAATGLRDKLLAGNGENEWVIHSRVLGNVMYFMAAMNTDKEVLRGVEERVLESL